MKETLLQYVWIGAAGSLAAMLRRLVSVSCDRLTGIGFPVGTLVVNLSGCLLLGWFLTLKGVSETTRLAVAVGFIGTYTTFSTFIYDSNQFLQDGSILKSATNILGSLFLGLVAVRAGIWLATR